MSYRIVIPVHNEEQHVEELLARFPERHLSSIIIVDDGSHDAAVKLVRAEYPQVAVLSHEHNLGKGAALRTGCDFAAKANVDYIILMDGDLQHKPEDVNRFLKAFQRNKDLEIAFGARHIGLNMRLVPFVGNKLLTVIINLCFGYFLNDSQCGFKAFRASVYSKIRWNSQGYAAETEMVIKAAKHDLVYKEIEIETIYLDYYKGTSIRDGLVILLKILAWRFFSWRG